MSEADNEPVDAAAEAFEGVRADLAKMMTMLEAAKPAQVVDYSLTLGRIAKSLAVIEAHPVMKVAPDAYQQSITLSIQGVSKRLEGEMQRAIDAVTLASREMQRAIGAKRERRAQLEWALMAGAWGLFLGILVWGQGSGPIARALPASWRIPETLAAATLNMDRWDAGARLMRVENPVEWAAILEGAKIERENRSALLTCWAAAQRAGRPQRCTISVTAGS
ncbi:MAG: DUF6118 family protein [Caulobacteraceae bacterium]